MGSNTRLTLFTKLQVRWVVADQRLCDASLQLQQKVLICGTELFVYRNSGKF